MEFQQYYLRPGAPKIVQWIIKYSGGLIKNEKQASYVLIGFATVAIIMSLVLTFESKTETPRAVQYREDISDEVRKKLPPGVWETIPSRLK